MFLKNLVSCVLCTATYLVPDRIVCFLHRHFGGKNYLRVGLDIRCKEDQRLGSIQHTFVGHAGIYKQLLHYWRNR